MVVVVCMCVCVRVYECVCVLFSCILTCCVFMYIHTCTFLVAKLSCTEKTSYISWGACFIVCHACYCLRVQFSSVHVWSWCKVLRLIGFCSTALYAFNYVSIIIALSDLSLFIALSDFKLKIPFLIFSLILYVCVITYQFILSWCGGFKFYSPNFGDG